MSEWEISRATVCSSLLKDICAAFREANQPSTLSWKRGAFAVHLAKDERLNFLKELTYEMFWS